MQKQIQLRLLPREAADDSIIRQYISSVESVPLHLVNGYSIIRQSLDARGKQPLVSLSLNVFINEPFAPVRTRLPELPDVSKSKHRVLVAGAGPAGLFAAIRLIRLGIKPIIIERGKDVRARRRDLARMNKEGIVNPESNYCFGEGGAGTYSDGKLYTRSNKRGDINSVLQTLVHYVAHESILYMAHPHIGTNKLPGIISAIRQSLIGHGADFYFEKKLSGFVISRDKLKAIITSDKQQLEADAFILATGHSARDIFRLLHDHNLLIEAKPFALGVRVEHPQALIDGFQYKLSNQPGANSKRDPFLPPASYSLVEQVDGKGVFSFCMCPGGIIAPAATALGEIVVNGWSPSKRNNPYANSGMVVSVELADLGAFSKYGPLAALKFQESVEQKAFASTAEGLIAPAQRLADFTRNRLSTSLPDCSYLPGTASVMIKNVLPSFISQRLQVAFREFDKKLRGYLTNEAIILATESRTSSPVRIPRDPHYLHHPQLRNLYPCGEGAGYAGGIMSAAMDGEKVATMVAAKLGIKA